MSTGVQRHPASTNASYTNNNSSSSSSSRSRRKGSGSNYRMKQRSPRHSAQTPSASANSVVAEKGSSLEQKNGGQKRTNKTVDKEDQGMSGCFCCLSVKPHVVESKRPSSSNDLQTKMDNSLADDKVTPDDIKKWAESFDYLLHSLAGQKVFRDFLKMEYSEENILFYLACEELKKERNPEAAEEKARLIYEDYISILSPKEVSLDSRVREIINANMIEPSQHTFDEAQLQIYTLMHRDSYPRFLNSRVYKDMLNTFAVVS